MRIKVCGVQSADELRLLDDCGVDHAGLWWNLADGKHNLDAERLAALLALPLAHTRPVLVTIGRSVDDLAEVLERHAIPAVQLSGFELPTFVATLRARLPTLRIFKTLHVQGQMCLESAFIDAYLRAGVDDFIVDSFVSRQAAGSTGVRVAPQVVHALARRLAPRRLMLAGGVTVQNLAETPSDQVWGIDVDTAARGPLGIVRSKVAELVAAARGLARAPQRQPQEALA